MKVTENTGIFIAACQKWAQKERACKTQPN